MARHAELGVPRAIKLLTRTSGHLLHRAMREAQLQARLSHPNIVPLLDVFRVGEAPALVLEYIDGPTLETLLRHYQPGFTQVDALARGLIEGLIYAHGAGLVHRDLKPANIMVSMRDGGVQARIADFGLARICAPSGDVQPGPRITQFGAMMGTPAYMAPEQYEDAATVDGRADVFGLGAVLYELLTGVMAFPSLDPSDCYRAMVTCSWRPVRELVPAAPDRMVRAIEGALRPTPGERISSARALLETWTGQREGRPAPLPAGPDEIWESAHIELLRGLAPRVDPLATNGACSDHTRSTPTMATPAETPERSVVSTPSPEQMEDSLFTQVPPSADATDDWIVLDAAPARPRRWRALGLISALILLSGLIYLALEAEAPRGDASPAPVPVVAASAPEAQEVVTSPPDLDADLAGTPVIPRGAARASPPSTNRARASPDEPARATAELGAAPENVVVTGVSRSYLVAADGTRHTPGRVPPGRYALSVFFEPGEPTSVLDLDVIEGQTYHIRCEPGLRLCR